MLTYSCPTDKEQPIKTKESLHEFLKAGFKTGRGKASKTVTPEGVITCRELHEDGSPHFHAFVQFAARLTTRDMRVFDFMGVHPNIKHASTAKAVKNFITYVTKDGDFVNHNIAIDAGGAKVRAPGRVETAYQTAMRMAKEGDFDGASEHMESNACADYTKFRKAIVGTWEAVYDKVMEDKEPVKIYDQWTSELKDIDLWAKLDGEDWRRCHVLVGKSGAGKTELALYLLKKAGCKRPVVIRNPEDVKLHKTADGFVFDECRVNLTEGDSKAWPYESQISLLDTKHNGSLPARYGNGRLGRNVLRVLTTNNLSRALAIDHEQVARRVIIHNIEAKLF